MQATNGTLSELGERPLISRIRRQTAGGGDVVTGIGDDCAVVRLTPDAAEDLVLKSDPVICGHHFLPDADPRLVGRKALGRVLSDIASMGAAPRWILVDLVAPGDTAVRDIDAAYARLKDKVALVHDMKVMPWGNKTFQFRDPEGTAVSLYMPVTDAARQRFAAR